MSAVPMRCLRGAGAPSPGLQLLTTGAQLLSPEAAVPRWQLLTSLNAVWDPRRQKQAVCPSWEVAGGTDTRQQERRPNVLQNPAHRLEKILVQTKEKLLCNAAANSVPDHAGREDPPLPMGFPTRRGLGRHSADAQAVPAVPRWRGQDAGEARVPGRWSSWDLKESSSAAAGLSGRHHRADSMRTQHAAALLSCPAFSTASSLLQKEGDAFGGSIKGEVRSGVEAQLQDRKGGGGGAEDGDGGHSGEELGRINGGRASVDGRHESPESPIEAELEALKGLQISVDPLALKDFEDLQALAPSLKGLEALDLELLNEDRVQGAAATAMDRTDGEPEAEAGAEGKEEEDDLFWNQGEFDKTLPPVDYAHILEVEDIVRVLINTRGRDVVVLNVRNRCEWTDSMVLVTGRSVRHMRGMADAVVFEAKQKCAQLGVEEGTFTPQVEGRDAMHWMLVDCGSVVVNFFSEDGRSMYKLEKLWGGERSSIA